MQINWNPEEHDAKISALKDKKIFLLNTPSKYKPAQYLEVLKLNQQIWELEMEKVSNNFLEKLENITYIDLHGKTIDEAEHILFFLFEWMCSNSEIPESMEIITGRGTLRLYNWLEKNLQLIINEYDLPLETIIYNPDNFHFTIKFKKSFHRHLRNF